MLIKIKMLICNLKIEKYNNYYGTVHTNFVSLVNI